MRATILTGFVAWRQFSASGSLTQPGRAAWHGAIRRTTRVAILAELPHGVVPQSQLPDVVEDMPVGLHGGRSVRGVRSNERVSGMRIWTDVRTPLNKLRFGHDSTCGRGEAPGSGPIRIRRMNHQV
jgi:hypothetical protein